MVRIYNSHVWKRLELRHKKREARLPCVILATLFWLFWSPFLSAFIAGYFTSTTGGAYLLWLCLFGLATFGLWRVYEWGDLK